MRILLLCVLIVCTGSSLLSQSSLPILAKDCLPKVQQMATTLLDDARLMQVATIELYNAPLVGNSKFDMKTGKANVWVYGYRGNDGIGEAISLVAYKSALNNDCIVIPTTNDTSNITTYPIADTWINSGEIEAWMSRSTVFQTYRIQFPDSTFNALYCSNEQGLGTDETPFPAFSTIWIGTARIPNTSQVLICGFDIAGTETYCNTITVGVDEDASAILKPTIFPNPASELVIVNIPEKIQKTVDAVLLYDVNGTQVMNATSQYSIQGSGSMAIPIRHLAPATYMLRVISGGKSYTAPVVIHR